VGGSCVDGDCNGDCGGETQPTAVSAMSLDADEIGVRPLRARMLCEIDRDLRGVPLPVKLPRGPAVASAAATCGEIAHAGSLENASLNRLGLSLGRSISIFAPCGEAVAHHCVEGELRSDNALARLITIWLSGGDEGLDSDERLRLWLGLRGLVGSARGGTLPLSGGGNVAGSGKYGAVVSV